MEIKKTLYNIFILLLLFVSCNKTKKESDTSFKILPCGQGYSYFKMCVGGNGNILTYAFANGTSSIRQQFNLIKPNGDVIKTFYLSDTIYTYISMVQGIDGGFFIVASGRYYKYFSIYKLDDDGNILWSQNRKTNNNIFYYQNSVCKSPDNSSYLILYEINTGVGNMDCHLEKLDLKGNTIFNKSIPKPYALHSSNAKPGEEIINSVYQPNDTSIMIEGNEQDKYASRYARNNFIKVLRPDMKAKMYIQNFDSTKFESSIGTFFTTENKIFQFGDFTPTDIVWVNTDFFLRIFNSSGILEKEIVYPRIEGKYSTMNKTIAAPDGGYLIVGANNVLTSYFADPDTKTAIVKINSDGSFNWSKTVKTIYPATGYDAIYLPDGTFAVLAVMYEKYVISKLIYMHFDSEGNIIKN